MYRAFTRIDAGEVPDAKTILKIAGALGPDVISHLHRQVVEEREAGGGDARPPLSHRYDGRRNQCALSDRQHVLAGRRARVDPHDGTGQYRPRRRARSDSQSAAQRHAGRLDDRLSGPLAEDPDAMVQSYRKLMATTRAVLRDADTMVRRLDQRRRTAPAGTASILERAQRHLRQLRPLVQRVVAQTRARLMGGDTHVPDKVLSVFEPHTTTIRRQDLEAERIREPRDDSGIGASDHHRLRGARGPSSGRHDVDASLGPTSRHLRARRISPPVIGASAR